MTGFLWITALIVLASVGAALLRALRGPSRADRIMAVQLIGTGSMGVLVLIATAREDTSFLDVALVVALLAAIPAIAFVKAVTPDGAGDPELEDETP